MRSLLLLKSLAQMLTQQQFYQKQMAFLACEYKALKDFHGGKDVSTLLPTNDWYRQDFINTDTDTNTAYDTGTYQYVYLHYYLLFSAKSRHDGIKRYLDIADFNIFC